MASLPRSNWLAAAAIAVFMAAGATTAAAQETGTVRGKVVESQSLRPIAGAQVTVVGTPRAGLTNSSGDFLILNVPAGERQVRVQMIGYGAQARLVQVVAGETAQVEFNLSPAAIDLEAIVVTGTAGAASKRTLGHAISTLDAASITRTSTISSTVDLLQARTPGVQILPNSGTPGTAPDIRVRGASSFLNNRPVIFVDGIRINTGSLGNFDPSGASTTSFSAQATSALDLVHPSDIESIEVIKGPAAATLYGAEAAGGVIQIITKQGQRGAQPLRFDLRAERAMNEWGASTLTNYTVCDAAKISAVDAGGNPVWPGCQGQSIGHTLTDDPMRRDPLALRTGDVNRVSLSARGASDHVRYYVSVTNDQEQGVFHNSHNKRTAIRANLSADPLDWITFNVNSSYTRGDLRLPLGDESAQALLLSASRGRPGLAPPGGDESRAGWFTTTPEMANAYNNRTSSDRFIVGSTMTARPVPWFTNRLTVGMDYTSALAEIISPPGSVDASFAGAPEGIVARRTPQTRHVTFDYASSVDFPLSADLHGTTSAGVQAISRRTETVLASGRGFGAEGVLLIGTAQITSGSNAISESRSLGYYLQQQVAWRDRLYMTVGARADDHSAFGENFNILVYPKASVSYVASEEPALRNLFDRVRFDEFRLRAAYGHAGQAPLPYTASQAYTINRAIVGGNVVSAVQPFRFGNPDLKAERGEEYEFGFDASILEDRLGLEFTYYNKRMRDVIISSGVAGSSGFGGTFYGGTIAQMLNLGETSNRGIELAALINPVRTRNLSWESRISLATNSNELVSFGDDRTELVPFAPYGNVQRHREGYPLAGYWGQLPQRNADGTPVVVDGVVQLQDLDFIGPSAPTREIGFLNMFTVRRDFRLSVLLDYKGGHYQYNWKEVNRCISVQNCARLADPSNVNLVTGEVLNPEVYVWRQNTASYIESADFIKLRDVSLTYDLPAAIAARFGAGSASVTLAGRNLAQWTDYSGLDPETNNYGNRDFIRADVYAAPMTRRMSMSLNVSF